MKKNPLGTKDMAKLLIYRKVKFWLFFETKTQRGIYMVL